jgi:hypothetical protein
MNVQLQWRARLGIPGVVAGRGVVIAITRAKLTENVSSMLAGK